MSGRAVVLLIGIAPVLDEIGAGLLECQVPLAHLVVQAVLELVLHVRIPRRSLRLRP